jgi:transcriptional regulator with XRE-family HTH domain
MLNSRTKASTLGRGENISPSPISRELQLVGSKLKKLRETRKESLYRAAKGLRMSASALKKIEGGLKSYRILTLDKICVYYGTTAYEILGPG